MAAVSAMVGQTAAAAAIPVGSMAALPAGTTALPVGTTSVNSTPAAAPPAAAPRAIKSAALALPAVNQCNGSDNVGGQAGACDVTVVNNLDQATGVTAPP